MSFKISYLEERYYGYDDWYDWVKEETIREIRDDYTLIDEQKDKNIKSLNSGDLLISDFSSYKEHIHEWLSIADFKKDCTFPIDLEFSFFDWDGRSYNLKSKDDPSEHYYEVAVNFEATASLEKLVKELTDFGEPEDYGIGYIDYNLDDVQHGWLTIKGKNEDIEKLIDIIGGIGQIMEKFYNLPALGLEIGARVKKGKFESYPKNRIILRKKIEGTNKYKESFIKCVHTAIYHTTLDEYDEDMILNVKSNEGTRINLPIDQHFIALKSFVAGIVEFGLMYLMRESYNYGSMNFGFNNAMHKQFIDAISKIDGDLAFEIIEMFFIDVLNSMPYQKAKNWLISRFNTLIARFNIRAFRIINQSKVKIYKTEYDLDSDFDRFIAFSSKFDENMKSKLMIRSSSLRDKHLAEFLESDDHKRIMEKEGLGALFD